MANPEGSPADEPEWLAYNGPELPGDPLDLDQFMGAQRGLWKIMDIVANCHEAGLVLTPEMVIDYCLAWSEEEADAYPGFAFTVPNVYACSERTLTNLERFELYDDYFTLALATHMVLEDATAVYLMSDADRALWRQAQGGELECVDCGNERAVIPHLSKDANGDLRGEAIPCCDTCDADPMDDPWLILPDDDDDEIPF